MYDIYQSPKSYAFSSYTNQFLSYNFACLRPIKVSTIIISLHSSKFFEVLSYVSCNKYKKTRNIGNQFNFTKLYHIEDYNIIHIIC